MDFRSNGIIRQTINGNLIFQSSSGAVSIGFCNQYKIGRFKTVSGPIDRLPNPIELKLAYSIGVFNWPVPSSSAFTSIGYRNRTMTRLVAELYCVPLVVSEQFGDW